MATQTSTQTNSFSVSSGAAGGPVQTVLNFYKAPEDGSKPHNWVEKPTDGTPQRNFSDTSKDITVNDIRGKESSFNLDKNGFAAYTSVPTNMSYEDFQSDETIKLKYYPEVESILLERAPGAKRVLLFDHTIRRADPKADRAPVTRVHVDQTPKSAAQRVEYHLPDEAETLLKGRHRIINVWRPLNGPVETWPLAVGDGATVKPDDLVPVEHRYPDRTGETAAVQHADAMRFYYLSGMQNDERLFLQCFDSANPSMRTPHTAFEDARLGKDGKPRESIEVRALVFG